MLLVLVEGLSKLGAECRELGLRTDGSFEFGLNSGKAVLSVSDCLFCMCAWQMGKVLF